MAALPWPELPDPPVDLLVAQLATVPHAASWTLSGGEPTTRADLPRLLRALADAGAPDLGLATDGLSLGAPRVAETLRDAGLQRVRVTVHSGRIDAHDWLAGTPGGLKRARVGIDRARAVGLAIELEVALTRPTTPYLAETVELAAALGARAVVVRALDPTWAAPPLAVALCPRLALIRPAVEEAWRVGRRRGVAVRLAGVPHCATGAADVARDRPGTERWLVPADPAWEPLFAALHPPAEPGCASCPADCPGPTSAYVRLMGRSELDPAPAAAAYQPAEPPTGTARLVLPADRSTRAIRLDLVRVIQQRPAVLELVGLLSHPKAPELAAELRVLEPEVVLIDPLAAVAARTDALLKRIAPYATLDVGLPEGADPAHGRALFDRLTTAGVRHRSHEDAAGDDKPHDGRRLR